MKVAIIGSRSLEIENIELYIPKECAEIVSGGAVGVDTCAASFARRHKIKLTEFLPEYEKYGRAAPIMRNKMIVEYSDTVIVFWDGKSKGTLFVINYCESIGKECHVIEISN
ncbi:MAG: hypothetical protein J6Q77_01695 [Clostridia bacterium]|nr:hypothetical protein [Clostridia bacterium]